MFTRTKVSSLTIAILLMLILLPRIPTAATSPSLLPVEDERPQIPRAAGEPAAGADTTIDAGSEEVVSQGVPMDSAAALSLPGMVKDINPGVSGSWPQDLANVNGTLFFYADDGTHGEELWKSDGTTAGTAMVKDINPNGGSLWPPSLLTNVNGTLFFCAYDGTHGPALWKSDGTEAGTVLVKDIYPGASFNPLYELTNVNGTLFFRAKDGIHGAELWKSDGTEAGTVLVKDIYPGASFGSPYELTNVNGTLFFYADDGTHGQELWKSDGTTAGTVLVKDIIPGGFSPTPQNLTAVDGTLFFGVGGGHELWKSDGTEAGTVLVKEIRLDGNSWPQNLTAVNDTLFFQAGEVTYGYELWKSDGTEAGTVLVKDIYPGSSGSQPQNLTAVNGTLFFYADDGTHGNELWKSDGTEAGTVLVKDIFPGDDDAPENLTNVNGMLFFRADDGTHGWELWKSDGTGTGTVMVKDIYPGNVGSSPDYLTEVNGELFFSAIDGVHGHELWGPKPSPYRVTVTKQATPDPVYGGDPLTYTIRVTNIGSETLTATITDVLPAQVTTTQATSWSGVTLVPGEICTKELVVTTTLGYSGALTNVVEVTTVQGATGSAMNVVQARRHRYSLRTSSLNFVPTHPGHTVLLYTLSEDSEPNCCSTRQDFYVLVDDKGTPLRMENDGAGQNNRGHADFIAGDCHHSLWFTPTENSLYPLYLYAVPTGESFNKDYFVGGVMLWPETKPDLAVLTDLRELYNEFNRTDTNSASNDSNHNCIRDYYEAVERIQQYAGAHKGVVLDVRQNAYVLDYTYTISTATRKDMGQDIDRRLIAPLLPMSPTLRSLAIIGDDAVVPFYRIPVPTKAFSETDYPRELNIGADGNPTLLDTESTHGGANKGHLMSDVPYGVFTTTLHNYPKPNMNVGRIHYANPLQLVAATDAYSQPLDLRAAQSSAAALYLHNEPDQGKMIGGTWVVITPGIKWVKIFHRDIRPVLQNHYGITTTNSVAYTRPVTFENGHAYLYNGDRTNWNAVTTTRRAAQHTDLMIFYSHADHLSWSSRARLQGGIAGAKDITATDLVSANLGLALSTGCHSGYNTAYHQITPNHPYYRQSLVRAFLDRHVAYFAPTVYGTGLDKKNAQHDMLMRNFLVATFRRTSSTIGHAYHAAFTEYKKTGNSQRDKDFDKYVLYGTNFFGLPTQPLQHRAPPAVLRVFRVGSQPLSESGIHSSMAPVTVTDSITLSHFVSFDEEDRAVFDIPHQGGRAGESFGPVLPAVYRTYRLPLQATDIAVTLVDTQTHTYPTPVDLQTMTPFVISFGPLSGDFTYTHPYPASVLETQVVADWEGLILDITALPLQYNPDTRQVTLYDRLVYRITYQAPTTVTVESLNVNGGNPVPTGSNAIPVSLTLQSAVPLSGTLVWAVEDGTGMTVADDLADINLPAGTIALDWDVDTTNWMPGSMRLWVAVHDAEGKVIASSWTDLLATGQWLTAETSQSAYSEADDVLEVRAYVRDETGAGVGGQAGVLNLWLDGSSTEVTWQEGDDGLYTATVSLSGLAAGSHAFSTRLGTLTDSGGFLVDRSAPTSTVWLKATGTTTTTWTFVGWSDDATGPAVITVEYQVDGEAWEFWRAFRPGYYMGEDAVFGPTDPLTVDTTQHTYCFRSQAEDGVGHQETEHVEPDVCIGPQAQRHIYLPLVLRNYSPGLLYFDDFSDPNSGWPVSDRSDYALDYHDGNYRIQLKRENWAVWAWPGFACADCTIEVEAWRSTGANSRYGIVFGLNSSGDQFYLFRVQPGRQEYRLQRYDNGTWVDLIPYTYSSYINSYYSHNQLKVTRNGSQIRLYINDHYLDSYSDSTYSGTRRVGLYAGSGSTSPVWLRYDDFTVWGAGYGATSAIESGSGGVGAAVASPD